MKTKCVCFSSLFKVKKQNKTKQQSMKICVFWLKLPHALMISSVGRVGVTYVEVLRSIPDPLLFISLSHLTTVHFCFFHPVVIHMMKSWKRNKHAKPFGFVLQRNLFPKLFKEKSVKCVHKFWMGQRLTCKNAFYKQHSTETSIICKISLFRK